MSNKKFQYNFTKENQLVELKDKIDDLEQENNLLKSSLEELIKVNTELTQSIEQFNNQNLQSDQQVQQMYIMESTIVTLNHQVQNLQKIVAQFQEERHKRGQNSDYVDERETQSLVNVLQELIQSFKNMQTRNENEMMEFQRNFQQYKTNYEFALKKLEEEYKQKLNTLQPIILQLTRKDDNLKYIQQKLSQLENRKQQRILKKNKQEQVIHSNTRHNAEIKRLQDQIDTKNRTLKAYQQLIDRLKIKFNEKL